MPRQPIDPIYNDSYFILPKDKIDCAYKIDQSQLNDAKIYSTREEYIKSLPKNIDYMEIGVAWGYYSELVAKECLPNKIHLVDFFDQDLKCWSYRKFGECKCRNIKHEILYTPETHESFIIEKFSSFNNVKTFKGNAKNILPNINEKYDYIYIDITNDRSDIRPTLLHASRMVKVGGVIGFNDYLIYDGIIDDKPYATFQVVNEFLMENKNWKVDAIALHVLGFFDIYIKKVFYE